jgi:hypothetical protein
MHRAGTPWHRGYARLEKVNSAQPGRAFSLEGDVSAMEFFHGHGRLTDTGGDP